jgi:hypothetical protein
VPKKKKKKWHVRARNFITKQAVVFTIEAETPDEARKIVELKRVVDARKPIVVTEIDEELE